MRSYCFYLARASAEMHSLNIRVHNYWSPFAYDLFSIQILNCKIAIVTLAPMLFYNMAAYLTEQ